MPFFYYVEATVKLTQMPFTTHNDLEPSTIRLHIPPRTLPEAELGAVFYNVSCYQAGPESSQHPVCRDTLLPVSTTEYVITGLDISQQIRAEVSVIRNFNGTVHEEDMKQTENFCAGIFSQFLWQIHCCQTGRHPFPRNFQFHSFWCIKSYSLIEVFMHILYYGCNDSISSYFVLKEENWVTFTPMWPHSLDDGQRL